mmetsp:Transcript_46211/g.77022  ORF Transcript_46211/g.77022 Transcript_46211/m.77022 type:complete len:167 (+) Transcript_46211:173-673(+)|eukprot:CAMPEP_0198207824 /NCGR_PEP_ID=MMETSP1445-20131203/11244_1 /TAXON_ID=36898 /ORGANISM="Pyramimonas sp., Strain CCMP2087" /LENGTH=166 /DNA_ID=CAMNT_0043880985 /DNA_START=173 /DNA_END=673 /DNA_ORIENTATION=-
MLRALQRGASRALGAQRLPYESRVSLSETCDAIRGPCFTTMFVPSAPRLLHHLTERDVSVSAAAAVACLKQIRGGVFPAASLEHPQQRHTKERTLSRVQWSDILPPTIRPSSAVEEMPWRLGPEEVAKPMPGSGEALQASSVKKKRKAKMNKHKHRKRLKLNRHKN